jgi:cell division protein FtsZ
MLDDKLEDEVWITVVATGYGDKRPTRREEEPRRFSEPAGEPRVMRNGQRERSARIDVDVPEFIPRF